MILDGFWAFSMPLDLALLTNAGKTTHTHTHTHTVMARIQWVKDKHACGVCSATVASAPALACHVRAAHKQRTGLRNFLDGSGICPVCATVFSSRLQVLAHVSERRKRSKRDTVSCRERLEAGFMQPLSPEKVKLFDEVDRLTRAKARRESGRSRPLVLMKASRSRVRASVMPVAGDSRASGLMHGDLFNHDLNPCGAKRRRLRFKQPLL